MRKLEDISVPELHTARIPKVPGFNVEELDIRLVGLCEACSRLKSRSQKREQALLAQSDIISRKKGNRNMAELKGSKTHQNLKDAFAGESMANRRYLYFAKVADVEGYPEIAGNFRDTAEGETGHAHGHLDYLKKVGDPATDQPFGDTALNSSRLFTARLTSTRICIRVWRRPRAKKASPRSPIGLRRWPRPRSLTPGRFSNLLSSIS